MCEKGESSGIVTLMELDWYSKKVFASNSARRVATLTSFMGIVSLASHPSRRVQSPNGVGEI